MSHFVNERVVFRFEEMNETGIVVLELMAGLTKSELALPQVVFQLGSSAEWADSGKAAAIQARAVHRRRAMAHNVRLLPAVRL